jgi:hypothetical protein
VLVEDGGIVGVEPVASEPPSDCELLDYGDATVLPGNHMTASHHAAYAPAFAARIALT